MSCIYDCNQNHHSVLDYLAKIQLQLGNMHSNSVDMLNRPCRNQINNQIYLTCLGMVHIAMNYY